MKENTIEEMFARYQPDLGDPNEYMEHLTKKLEAAEYVKQYKAAQLRRYRREILISFVAGLIVGSILMLITLLNPPTWLIPQIAVPTVSATFANIIPKVCLLLSICLICVGASGLVGSVVMNRLR